MKASKKALAILFPVLATSLAPAQAVVSTQSHDGKVNAFTICESEKEFDRAFYSAGEDGFLIKWSSDGMGEHYQVSDLKIQLVARNPASGEIAVYETDGVSTHRLSVINSNSFAKKFSKKFSAPITSLSFSERGSYLIVGTTAAGGTYIINSKTGTISKKALDISGIVTMAKSGAAEKTAVFYTLSGALVYYDLLAMKVRLRLNTESGLEQPIVFGTGKQKDRFFAGTKENSIYLIDATSGKTIGIYQVSEPIIFASKFEEAERQGLYFISKSGKNYSLKLINGEMLQRQIEAGQISGAPSPIVVKNFTGLKSHDSFTCAAKNSGTVMLGTQSGDIYAMSDVPESELYSLFPITENMYEKIYDIDCENDEFFFLTQNSVFKTSFDTYEMKRLASNPGHGNLLKHESKAILWSRDTSMPVQAVTLDGSTTSPETLFVPANELRNLRIFGEKLIYILGTSVVGIYDLKTHKNSVCYTGTSVQDAVIINENTIYVAKTTTGAGDSPIISVNIQTRETLPLKFKGNVAFSLSYDAKQENSALYGITLTSENGVPKTEVFSYKPNSGAYATLLKLSDEDTSAFTTVKLPMLYSNIGKNQIYGYNVKEKKSITFRRSASMPLKAVCSTSRVAVLNYNGSISWYSPTVQIPLANWYQTVDGEWFEL